MEAKSCFSRESLEQLKVENFLLRSKLECHEETFQQIRLTSDLNKIKLEEYRQKLEESSQHEEAQNQLLQQIRNDLEQKNSALPLLESELAALKEKLVENDKSQSEVELFLLKSKLSSYQKHIEELETVAEKARENQEQMIKTSMEHEQQVSGLKQDLKESMNQTEKLRQEISNLQNLLKTEDKSKQDQAALENVQDEKCQLEVQLFLAKSKLDSYQRHHSEMQTALETMTIESQKNLAELKQEKEQNWQETHNGLRAEVMQLQEELLKEKATGTNMIQSIQKDLVDKKCLLERMESEMTQLKDELAKSTDEGNEMEAQLFIINSKLSSSELRFDEMKSSLELELNKEKVEFERRIGVKDIEHRVQMEALQSAIEESRQKIQTLQGQLLLQHDAFTSQEAGKKLEQERDELAVNVLLLESKLCSYRTSHGQMLELLDAEKEKIRVLATQNSSLLGHLDKEKNKDKDVAKVLEAEINDKNHAIFMKDETIARLKETYEDQRLKYDKLEEDYFACREELLNLRNSTDEKNQAQVRAKEAYVAELQCQIQKLNEAKNLATIMNEEKEAKIELLTQANQTKEFLIQEAKQAQDQLTATMAAQSNQLTTDLNEAKAALNQTIVSSQVERVALEATFHSERSQLSLDYEMKLKEAEVKQEKWRLSEAENEAAIETLKKDIHKMSENMKELEAQVMKNEEDKGVNEAELTRRNEVISKLEQEIQSYKGQLCTKETCISALALAKDESEKKLVQLLTESKVDKEAITKLEAELSGAKTSIKNLEDKMVEMNENLESQILDKIAAEEEVDMLKQDNKDLKNNVADETSKNQDLTSKLSDIESEKAQLEAEMKRCQAENDENIKALQAEMKATAEKMKTLQAEKADMSRLLDDKEAEFMKSLDELEQDLAQKAQDCQDAQATNQQLKEENQTLVSNVNNLKLENETTRQGLLKSKENEEKITKDLETTRKEKESKTAKLRLLLSNQKKLEKDYQELQKVSDEMKLKLQDKAAIETELQVQKKRADDLEADLANEKNGEIDDADLPWNADPELKDMEPRELRKIFGNDLTGKEKAKLNELCAAQMEKALAAKEAAEGAYVWEISSLKKELEKYKFKVEQLKSKNSAAKAALLSSEENETRATDDEKRRRSIKRRSSPRIMTRSSTSSLKNDPSEPGTPSSPAVKKSRRDRSKDSISKMNGQENDARSMASKRKSRLGSIQLDKAMPTNPYKKSSDLAKIGSKKPLETITNKS